MLPNYTLLCTLNVPGIQSGIFGSLCKCEPLEVGFENRARRHIFLQCFMGNFDVTARIKMASAEEFYVNPYSFEPEYGSDEASSTSSDEDDGQDDSDEERIGRLHGLEWCICENCDTGTLNRPRECLCCREVSEVSALADFISQPISCITHHNDFAAVCLMRAVLKTTLVLKFSQFFLTQMPLKSNETLSLYFLL